MTLPIIGTTIKSSVCSKYMKFQKTGGKIGIPKKKSYEIPKKWKKNGIPKKFSWNSKKWGKKLEFVGFSLSSPVPTDYLINFEKFLRSKETSYQNSKNCIKTCFLDVPLTMNLHVNHWMRCSSHSTCHVGLRVAVSGFV